MNVNDTIPLWNFLVLCSGFPRTRATENVFPDSFLPTWHGKRINGCNSSSISSGSCPRRARHRTIYLQVRRIGHEHDSGISSHPSAGVYSPRAVAGTREPGGLFFWRHSAQTQTRNLYLACLSLRADPLRDPPIPLTSAKDV